MTVVDTSVQTGSLEYNLRSRKDKLEKQRIQLGDISAAGDDKVRINGDTIKLSDKAMQNWLSMLDIPKGFYNRCETDLQAQIVDKFLTDKRNWKLNPIIYDGKSILGFADEGTPMVHLYDAYQVVGNRLADLSSGHELSLRTGKSEYSQDTFVDEYGGVFSWSTDALVEEPKVGDVTEGGVRLILNDWLSFEPQLNHYANRLICANGMTHPYTHAFDINYVTDNDVISAIGDAADQVLESVQDDLLKPFINTYHHNVDDPMVAARSIIRDRGMGQRLGNRFLENVERMVQREDGPFTMYDLINAMTVVQNEDNIRWSDRAHLQAWGGEEAIEQSDRCRTCHHLLN